MPTIKKPFTKKGISQLTTKEPGIYKASDSQGNTIYVGKAKQNRLAPRLLEHLKEKDIPGAKKVLIKTTKSEKAALKLEKEEIIKLKPKHNIIHNPKKKK